MKHTQTAELLKHMRVCVCVCACGGCLQRCVLIALGPIYELLGPGRCLARA